MVGPSDVDIPAQSILNGLRALGDLLEEPVAREALDLARNLTTARQFDILKRLQRSLTQYLERDGDLLYVGFLGHFSSGKSSTINSLLEISDTPAARVTGLHPTDTTITLITRNSNVASLLGVIREGHVTIRSQAVDADLLETLVLVDTPGTGDPQLIEEISRDFLPICDEILFFFSAASPLDKADMPLLIELHERLPFIPVKFVVTRADELRADFSKPLSDSNLDASHRDGFFGEVLLRVNRLLQPKIYTAEDLFLVDNKTQFGIEPLRSTLLRASDRSLSRVQIKMHGHKLHFFVTSAKELKAFFDSFLSERLSQLTQVVAVAGQNIERYNEIVRISNSHFTKTWFDQHLLIRSTGDDALKALAVPEPLPLSMQSFEPVAREWASIRYSLMQEAQNSARNICTQLRALIVSQLRTYLADTETRISELEFGNLHVRDLLRDFPVIFDLETLSEILTSSGAPTAWSRLRHAELTALRVATDKLRQTVDRAGRLLAGRAPLTDCEAIVYGAQESLKGDLEKFFRNVELYRDGVFSHTTKEAISTLGIGGKLDQLEKEFNETDKSHFVSETMDAMFAGFGEFAARSTTRLSGLDGAVRSLVEMVHSLKLPSLAVNQDSLRDAASVRFRSLLDNLGAELRSDVRALQHKLDAVASAQLTRLQTDFHSEMRRATVSRRSHYVSLTLGAGLAAIAIYAGIRFLTTPIATSVFNVLIWGVVANIIGDAIGYYVAKARDRFPETSRAIRRRYAVAARRELTQIFETEVTSHDFQAISEARVANELVKAYEEVVKLDVDGWDDSAALYLGTLLKAAAEYKDVREDYTSVINDTVSKSAEYFADATRNLEVLNAVASKIKERAIEPSFTLLEETRHQLHDVKGRVQAIEFA